MADFPVGAYHKPVISSMSREAGGPVLSGLGGFAGASALWPTSNLALFVPFTLAEPYLVRKLWWANGSAAAGNFDVGVYSFGGSLITSAGATAQSGTSVVQSVTLGTPVLLTPGTYYMACSGSTGTTAQYFRFATTAIQNQIVGMLQMAAAHPLPATFTPATIAQVYMPLFGIASANTI